MSAERLAAIPALAMAIVVWNAMGYSMWMIVLATLIIFAVFFPKQAKALLNGLWSLAKWLWCVRNNRNTSKFKVINGGRR